jgi:phosphatidate cytidylyltransferase
MTRVLSGAALLVLATAVVWVAPAPLFLAAAEVLLLFAFVEYTRLVRACGIAIPVLATGAAAVLTCGAFGAAIVGLRAPSLEVVLMLVFVVLATLVVATWRRGREALSATAASLLPTLYLGLPIGAMVAVRETRGPDALFLLMLTIVVSDTAQYYTGLALGRRPLAPAISPKKTIEGAAGGFVFGSLSMAVLGQWWLPSVPIALRAALGAIVVVFGIVGDLFESMLKRSAGVKDSSSLIPGHGGVLDRIDALLFAAPVYYVVLRYV